MKVLLVLLDGMRPDAIGDIIKGSSAAIVSKARRPGAPYTPNVRQNATYGVLLGVLMAVAYVVLRVLMDVRVKGEEDLAMISDAPVLGVIPNFDSEEKESYGYAAKQDTDSKAVKQ